MTTPAGGDLIKKIDDSRGDWTAFDSDRIPNLTNMERDILIAALRASTDRAVTVSEDALVEKLSQGNVTEWEAAAHIKKQGAKIAQLKAALKPFVEADWYADGYGRFEGKVSTDSLDVAKAALLNRPQTGEVEKIDIVFDGPPGPEAGRFVEVDNSKGQSVKLGEWLQRPDGYWVLRLAHAGGESAK